MLSPELLKNPYPMYEHMRAAQPVTFMEQLNLWSVFRYDDVRSVLSDHTRFSSEYGQPAMPEAGAAGEARRRSPLITSDPPRHTQIRSLVNRAFTPRQVANLEPRIEAIANELLDAVIGKGEFDLVQDFSYPLPVIVIAEMLGIPAADRARFKDWSDDVVASADRMLGGTAQSQTAHEEMNAYFRAIIAERKRHPEGDLISALLSAEEENQHLAEEDILSLCWLLLVAGNETTTNLISNAVRTFLEFPEAFEEIKSRPDLLPAAIEEVLRYRSPVQAMFRITTVDVEMAGQTVPAGQRVIAWIGSANRDEAKFADAARFDIQRDPNPHIAFGHGIHFCLGAPLARLEAHVALSTLIRRMPNLARANDDALKPARGFIVHGLSNFPVVF